MLNVKDKKVREYLLQGHFGLERENLRVTPRGNLALTPHPFGGHPHITMDFSECQTEVNTEVTDSPAEAVQTLHRYHVYMEKKLASLPEPELLWPFSNPPFLRGEEDVPIAQFYGDKAAKTEYRKYLSDRYGRYKMTFSGIHFNYSFGEDLLKAGFEASGESDFQTYRDRLYLELTRRLCVYGWIVTALTAASPILDSSFFHTRSFCKDTFTGMASVRCSELGYWNYFTPVLDYSSLDGYADSIEKYVDEGWITAASELYYPIRLKPVGENTLDHLRKNGVSHIELRMIDLNPLVDTGIHEKDVEFMQLLILFLAATKTPALEVRDQVLAVQNFKNAAHYDLDTVRILLPGNKIDTARHMGIRMLTRMKEFYQGFSDHVQDVLLFEYKKLLYSNQRYAWQVRHYFNDHFVEKGLELAKRQQDACL